MNVTNPDTPQEPRALHPPNDRQGVDPDDLERLVHQLHKGNGDRPLTLRSWLALAEAWRITQALQQCRGNRSAAARALGIGRRTLYTKMEKLGITAKWGPCRGPTLQFSSREPSGRVARGNLGPRVE